MARGKKTAAPLKASTPSANGSSKSNKKTAGVAMKKQNKQTKAPIKDNKKPLEKKTRRFTVDREKEVQKMREDGSLSLASQLHVDDLSSDDEENVNTIGNVPLRWYEDYDHIGYNVDGKKIMKSNNGDGIDNAIAAKDDPNYDRTVYDAYNDRKIVISDRDMEIIRRMQAGAFAHPEFEAYPDYVDIYSSNKIIHSMGNDLEPKSRFLPS
ncbi:hypothetical protein PHPALM_8271, partial [Phytophthora palmivora]